MNHIYQIRMICLLFIRNISIHHDHIIFERDTSLISFFNKFNSYAETLEYQLQTKRKVTIINNQYGFEVYYIWLVTAK